MKGRISAAEIARDLNELLVDKSPGEIRSMLLNLVVVEPIRSTRQIGPVPATGALVESLLGKRPARIIWIRAGAESSGASVSARCLADSENRAICFEELLLDDGPDGAACDPASWSPLLIRGLPVIVLWRNSLSALEEFASRSAGLVDLFILDSATLAPEHLRESLASLASKGNRSGGAPLADIAWELLLPMRRLVAHAFEGALRLEALASLERVEAWHEAGPVPTRWLLEWIAERVAKAKAGNDAIKLLALEAPKADARSGVLVAQARFSFSSVGGASLIEGPLLIELCEDGSGLVNWGERAEWVEIPVPSLASILLRLVDYPKPDLMFYRMLGVVD